MTAGSGRNKWGKIKVRHYPLDRALDSFVIKAHLARMNVLVVEDEALVSLLMQEIVEQAGHACIGPAASVTEARALIDSRHVDAALLDIWLKYDEFVWPVARELARRGVPFAFVTARAADGIEPEFVDRPLFPKPAEERLVTEWLDEIN
jgi:CheY-like chemotaxis protein